jgi:ACS family hexuronate transporter-like MFS transporter
VQSKIGNYRWTICALVFFATTINYLDRQVLSLAYNRDSKKFLSWTNTDYANITAIFQITYAVTMLFVGRLVDRLGTRWGYGVAIIVWSIGALVHAFAIPIGEGLSALLGLIGVTTFSVSVLGFMFSRAVLALGESGNFPAAIKATAEYFPKHERSFATGIFNSGTSIGAILAPLSVPWMYLHWGWQTTFIAMGALGFLWLAVWLVMYKHPEKQTRLSDAERAYINKDEDDEKAGVQKDSNEGTTSWIKLLEYRQTWAFAFGKFMTDGVWWFFLFWLPAYLKAQYGIIDEAVMLPLAVLYTMSMVGSIAGGWLPAIFIKKGYGVFDGRMRAMFMIALFPLIILIAQPLGSITFWIPVLLIGVGTAAHQAWSANLFTTVSDMFPKKTIGAVIGIGGLAGGVGAVSITKLGGGLFDYYKALGHIETGYTIMFAICAVAYLVAWGVMKMLVPKYSPISDL